MKSLQKAHTPVNHSDPQMAEPPFDIIKRELLRSHRAQPDLVKNLLLTAQVNERSKEKAGILSMDLILHLCQFQQKMKWLCPWGAEIFDEVHRVPGCKKPYHLFDKLLDTMDERMKTNKQLTNLLMDEKQNWDRIYLRSFPLDCFMYLRRHPCEELYIQCYQGTLDRLHTQQIAACSTLRTIHLGFSSMHLKNIQEFKILPNLEKLYFFHAQTTANPVLMLGQLPKNTLLPIQQCRTHLQIPEKTQKKIISFVDMHRESLEHFKLECTLSPELSTALGKCTNVQSIHFRSPPAPSHECIELFGSPLIQKSVKAIFFFCLRPEDAEILAQCTNLRWLIIEGGSATAREINPIIRANANHLCEVSLLRCREVGNDVLNAIASCRCLRKVTLTHTAVTAEAMQRYEVERKPSWQALAFHEYPFNRISQRVQ